MPGSEAPTDAGAAEPLDSTCHVALATLPRPPRRRGAPAAAKVIEFREFQDGETVPGTRYRVTRLIGVGGMGRVYEVEHVELGKRFVLKALQRELARREDLVARLRNEWRALARLEHPNIVNVTDAGTSQNGVPFYVMERLEGEPLSALLHRARRLRPQQALPVAAAILDGLHAAHRIGVVHRDVKPPNIFLIGPTAVKVLDFGIAKINDAKNVITARGMAVGTPRYMSPEQASGTPVDARSDIYATGLILFEMVSGVGPFDDARDANELLLAQLGRKAPLLSSVSVVAPELDALVAAMLAKDPRERPRDAREVADALRALTQRYERYVATDAPTRASAPPGAPESEQPTRVEGRRSSRPAPAPAAATRPDGVAAAHGAAAHGNTTTLQPRLEIATTAVPQSAPPGRTLRMPHASLQAPTPYGPDTLLDRPTSAPTAVPEPTPERTEILLGVPGAPAGDAEATRTVVPLAEAPNLTPPPVVPSASLPPPKPARSGRRWLVAATAVAAVGLLGMVVLLIRGSSEPRRIEPLAAAAEPSQAPAPVVLPEPTRAAAEPGVPREPAGAAEPGAAPSLPTPPVPSPVNPTPRKSEKIPMATPAADSQRAPKPSPAARRASPPPAAPGGPMPASGL